MKRYNVAQPAAIVLLTGAMCALSAAEKGNAFIATTLPVRVWKDPGDVTRLSLFYGAGGKKQAPDPKSRYRYIKKPAHGRSVKFDVEDDRGVRWRVKLGDESQAETAATRLLWAAGFFVDEVYYLPEIKVHGLPKEVPSTGGVVASARLERREKGLKKLGSWEWSDNPFNNTKELNGLRVMMALMNNWDVKNSNNSIVELAGERRFMVSDLGATFGKTGRVGNRTKGRVDDYEATTFIDKLTPEYVNFILHSRPCFLMILDFYHYRQLTRREEISRHIPRTHARWLGHRLAGFAEDQIRDCFRAAGFSPTEIEGYTSTVRKRIAELNAL